MARERKSAARTGARRSSGRRRAPLLGQSKLWIGVAAAALLGGALWLNERERSPAGEDAQPEASSGAPVPLSEASLPEEGDPRRTRVTDSRQIDATDDPKKGSADAAVRIVEFADYQCPSCGQFFRTTQGALTALYGDRIQWVFLDFPLTQIHNRALPAAIAAACADRQGKFWPYHDLLFQNQDRMLDRDLRKYAREIGLDEEAWQTCYEKREPLPAIEKDMELGNELGVDGTPTFFVGGQTIEGAAPVTSFMEVIDPLLKAPAAGPPAAAAPAPASPSGAP